MKRFSIVFILLQVTTLCNFYLHAINTCSDTISIPIKSLELDSNAKQQLIRSMIPLLPSFHETRSLNPLMLTTSIYPVDISFLIADIKFDGESSLKVLEFGEGTRSKFKGFDTLYGDGKMWERFWHYLSQFNMPMWYVGPQLTTDYAKKQIAFNEFTKLSGNYCPTKQELDKKLNKKAAQTSQPKYQKITDYSAIALFRHRNASEPQSKSFKAHNPNTIILNYASAPYVNNKFLSSTLFEDEELSNYKPLWKSYQKRYTKSLAKKIIKDIPADIYVIKPVNAFKGNGVIMTTKDKLDFILKNILNKTTAVKKSKSPTYNYWAYDNNRIFIVERFEHSKTITVDEKPYEPTLRVVFTLHYDDQTIHLSFLGSYWKLPARALNEKASLVEKTKSSIDPDGKRPSSAIVEAQDMEKVKAILSNILPKLYVKMLQTRYLIH